MKFEYTIIYVANVLETVKLYEYAFGLKQKFIHESKLYAEMEIGETLAFVGKGAAELNRIAIALNDPSCLQVGRFVL